MRRIPDGSVFKPLQTRTETRSDATARAAREIIDTEATARAAKTERLRAARLARDESVPNIPVPKKTRVKT